MTEGISNKTSVQVDTILTLADPVEKSYCLLQNMFTGADIDLQFYKTGSWQTARSIFCSLFRSLGGVLIFRPEKTERPKYTRTRNS